MPCISVSIEISASEERQRTVKRIDLSGATLHLGAPVVQSSAPVTPFEAKRAARVAPTRPPWAPKADLIRAYMIGPSTGKAETLHALAAIGVS
jgi:hypothetical protein